MNHQHWPPAQPQAPNLPNNPLTNIGQTQIIYAICQCPCDRQLRDIADGALLPHAAEHGPSRQPNRASRRRAPPTSSAAPENQARQSAATVCERKDTEPRSTQNATHLASNRHPMRSPPPSLSPAVTAENSQSSGDEQYWMAVPQIDVSESICELLDGVSIQDLDNRPQKSKHYTTSSTGSPKGSPHSSPLTRKQGSPSFSVPMSPAAPFRVCPRVSPGLASTPGATPSIYQRTNPLLSPVPQSPSPGQSVAMPASTPNKKKKFYVVTRGRKVGIFGSWTEVEPLVKHIDARHESFKTRREAEEVFTDAERRGEVSIML